MGEAQGSHGGTRTALKWERVSDRPILGPDSGGHFAEGATAPDVVVQDDVAHVYAGAVQNRRERIARLTLPVEALVSGAPLDAGAARVVIDAGSYEFDALHVFDPAAVAREGRLYLYYTAMGKAGCVIALAVSDDWQGFRKCPAPILTGRAPEVVESGGRAYLVYVNQAREGHYFVDLAASTDGVRFARLGPGILPGPPGSWDSYEVTTPRIFERHGMFYAVYAGSDDPSRKDAPWAFGLARSRDLVNWEKYPDNPVFTCSEPGGWDDGAIWYGTVFEWDGVLYMLYEGARREDMHGDGPGRTCIGLAGVPADVFDRIAGQW